ncbi:hypothetical protein [Chamaesiphon sp.]|uniref:hypothetical protein n=1 Tax=Chamaesiphon sp. TaxID=2814140 RepID=UPI0035938AD5
MTFISQQILTDNLTEQQYQRACFQMTGTRCLHWLRAWCRKHQISQSSFKRLYFCIKAYIETHGQFKAEAEVWCCVNEQILEIESRSHQICDRVGLVLLAVDDSYEIYDGNILKGIVDSYPHDGWITTFLRQPGVSDRYTAALSFLSIEQIKSVSLTLCRERLEANLDLTADRIDN